MFKKSLIAAAVMATVSVPAFADVVIENKDTFTTTSLAKVTKQPVLSFSTAQEDVLVTFDTTGDLKQNGFITLELTGDATFNEAEVRNWLTDEAGTFTTVSYDGINVDAPAANKPFAVNGAGDPVDANGDLIDINGSVIEVGVQLRANFTDESVGGGLNEAAKVALVDAAKAYNDDINNIVAGTLADVDVAEMFRLESLGTGKVISHAIDLDGKRLRLALNDADGATIGAAEQVLVGAASDAPFLKGTQVQFNFTKANQIFNLKSNSTSSNVGLKVGALRNASYTADPKPTPALFKLADLFKLELNGLAGKATALVAERFARLDTTGNGLADNGNVDASFDLVNTTTNQNIQLNKVNLSIAGDYSGFRVDENGNLLNAAGTQTGWKVANGVATRLAGDAVLEGRDTLDASVGFDFVLNVLEANTAAIEGQKFSVRADIFGADQDTFEDFTASLADIVIIDRDGMKFDTITTGTTSANTIFVRDISGILPETGGKIFVTIVEYDEHGVNGRGEGTVLVDRAELATTLPSGGAVTLAPADVAAEVGAAITPARQARFVFEVETNQGEVAVKKSNSEGVDIQNGTKGVQGVVVDFTL